MAGKPAIAIRHPAAKQHPGTFSALAEKSQEDRIGPAEVRDRSPTNHHGQEDWPDLYSKFTLEAGVRAGNSKEGSQKKEEGGQDRQEQ